MELLARVTGWASSREPETEQPTSAFKSVLDASETRHEWETKNGNMEAGGQ